MSDLIIRNFAEGQELARSLKLSALVPEALRGKEADILFITLTGSEMGMGPMKALQAFEVIKGRVSMKPVYMLGMVRAHPTIESADIVESTATRAVVESKRKGSAKVLRTVFTIEDAKTAGLTSSEMYRKWPAQMLGWRAVAIHCRANHSDITGGHYTTEEVETFERDVTPPAEVVDAQPAVEAAKAAVKRRLNIVDVSSPPAPAASPPQPTGDSSPVLEWPEPYAGKTAAQLTAKQLEWCVNAATRECEKGGDDRELFERRLVGFTDEAARRAAAEVSP